MFIEEMYINEIAKKQAADIDKTIIEFVRKLGYKIEEPYVKDFKKIQEELSKEGKFIRCEIFSKTKTSNTPTVISCETVVIPFIDSIENPIPINEVKTMCNLGSEWF